jgi:hypothetical protein
VIAAAAGMLGGEKQAAGEWQGHGDGRASELPPARCNVTVRGTGRSKFLGKIIECVPLGRRKPPQELDGCVCLLLTQDSRDFVLSIQEGDFKGDLWRAQQTGALMGLSSLELVLFSGEMQYAAKRNQQTPSSSSTLTSDLISSHITLAWDKRVAR